MGKTEMTASAGISHMPVSNPGWNPGLPKGNEQETSAPGADVGIASGFMACGNANQRARQTSASSLAGRIRRRLGIEGLGEADMSLREVPSCMGGSHS